LDEKGEEATILADSLEGSKNIIVDYSIETSSVTRYSIEDYDSKVQVLNKFKNSQNNIVINIFFSSFTNTLRIHAYILEQTNF
jgi:hypothetical protein